MFQNAREEMQQKAPERKLVLLQRAMAAVLDEVERDEKLTPAERDQIFSQVTSSFNQLGHGGHGGQQPSHHFLVDSTPAIGGQPQQPDLDFRLNVSVCYIK